MRLHPDEVEAIARRVAELVNPARVGLVTVDGLAAELGVHPDWVYRHARALGGVKLGRSANAPWRFDLERSVTAALTMGEMPPSSAKPDRRQRARRGVPDMPAEAALLRGRSR